MEKNIQTLQDEQDVQDLRRQPSRRLTHIKKRELINAGYTFFDGEEYLLHKPVKQVVSVSPDDKISSLNKPVKIFLYPSLTSCSGAIPSERLNFERRCFELIENIEQTNYMELADILFVNAGFKETEIVKSELARYKDKIIVIDYRDDCKRLCPVAHKCYFKRSIIRKNNFNTSPQSYPIVIHPIAYPMKLFFEKNLNIVDYDKRNWDISCFFDENDKINTGRGKVSTILRNNNQLKKYKVHSGIVDSSGESGRTKVNHNYVEMIRHSKIIVTRNPDRWEGDYRLAESFSGGSLVFVDKMCAPHRYPLENRKHLIYYNNEDELVELLIFYLENPVEAKKIAKAGYDYVKQHRTIEQEFKTVINQFLSEI